MVGASQKLAELQGAMERPRSFGFVFGPKRRVWVSGIWVGRERDEGSLWHRLTFLRLRTGLHFHLCFRDVKPFKYIVSVSVGHS